MGRMFLLDVAENGDVRLGAQGFAISEQLGRATVHPALRITFLYIP